MTNPGNSMSLYRLLQGWLDSATWNTWNGGVQTDGVEAVATSDAVTGAVGTGLLSIDVKASLQAWLATPATNRGWVLVGGNDGVDFYSAQGATPPRLTVQYAAAPVTLPPQVAAVAINSSQVTPANLPAGPQPTSWQQQRSSIRDLVVTFSEPMAGIAAADLVLSNLGVNAPNDADNVVSLTGAQLALSDNNTKLTISFAANQLADGTYELQVLPSVTDVAGNPLDGDGNGVGGDAHVIRGNATNRFYVLKGDWNGTGGVNIQDFATFSYWFGQSVPTAPAYVDLNNSGGVNIQDFAGFAGNFGRGITYPAALGSAAPLSLSLAAGDGSNGLTESKGNMELLAQVSTFGPRVAELMTVVKSGTAKTVMEPRTAPRDRVFAQREDYSEKHHRQNLEATTSQLSRGRRQRHHLSDEPPDTALLDRLLER